MPTSKFLVVVAVSVFSIVIIVGVATWWPPLIIFGSLGLLVLWFTRRKAVSDS